VVSLAGVFLLPVATVHTLAPLLAHPDDHGVKAVAAHPDIALLVLFAVVSTLPTLRVARLLVHQATALRRLGMRVAGQETFSRSGIRFVRVHDGAVAIFTAGIRRPVIYVTSGAERLLSVQALDAALLHERAHILRRDVWWLSAVAAVEHAFGVLPWIRDACDAYRLAVERRADEDALRDGASRLGLFDAIAGAAAQPVIGASLSAVGVEQRLQWLADGDDAVEPDLAQPATAVLASVIALPTTAHLLVWLGVLCVVCWSHVA
jgi:beta-lactamase regulating signal transducer with metallopeptidase domain